MAQRRLGIGLLTGIVISLLIGAATVVAQEELPEELPAPSVPWRKQAWKLSLGDKAIEQLARDRVLMTDQRFKQVFTPYVDSEYPVFITSDSLLNTFHVLFEESFIQLEKIQAARLRHFLAALAEKLAEADAKLSGDKALIAAAKRHATILIAVARALLGDEPSGLPAEVAEIVRAEAARVTTASGTSKPAWLGEPDPGFLAIDYGRFKVRGFYTRTDLLRRHFRAVAWLQAIPLRVGDDEELLTAAMLGGASVQLDDLQKRSDEQEIERLLGTYREIIGLGDDWDLARAALDLGWHTVAERDFHVGPASLAKARSEALESARRQGFVSLIGDQIRFPSPKSLTAEQIGYRVLAAHRTPCGILLRRTTDQRDPELRGRTLPTGLEIAALLGSDVARGELAGTPRVLAVIGEAAELLEGRSLFAEYLRCLQALVDAPEPDAPKFLSARPWRIKQLNTVLAGWAQMRHTFVLQAKQGFTVYCIDSLPVGFVEPEPEFFARFGRFVARTRALLQQAGATGVFATETLDSERPRGAECRIDFGMAWDLLHDLCFRLEILAHKQLRGVAFNRTERGFILAYGKQIAELQFHSSNSYKAPRDDAPRIADVHADPAGKQVLLVGVARPRALWVLYPWRGKDVLCRGAVMPYRELTSPTRLADKQWMRRLDSAKRPPAPTWLAPLSARSPPSK